MGTAQAIFVVDGDVTGYAVTGSDRIRMRDRI
jgi:hypothetical protein